MPTDYCSTAELKQRLWPSGVTDVTDDTVFASIITAVSNLMETKCGEKRFYATAETRYYTPEFPDLLYVDDLLSVTTLKTDEDGDRVYERTWAVTDYDLEPANAQLGSQPKPYTRIRVAPRGVYSFPVRARKGVQLVGSFGFSTSVPARIKEACLLQCERIYKRKDAPFGVMGSAELGQLQVIPRLDPDVEQMLAAFMPGPDIKGVG